MESRIYGCLIPSRPFGEIPMFKSLEFSEQLELDHLNHRSKTKKPFLFHILSLKEENKFSIAEIQLWTPPMNNYVIERQMFPNLIAP